MTSITSQQTKLDLELFPKENRLVIGKYNGRIPRGLKPKEEIFQVVLDVLALTTSYPTFIITADVPEVYMNKFWNSVYKHDTFYRFKIDKKKRFKLTLEVFRDIFQICLRVQDRVFDALPSEEDTISFLRDLGHARFINSLNDAIFDHMHQLWRTFAALINRSLSGKTSALDKLYLSQPTHTGKEVVQGEGADVEMIDAQQGNENLETTQEQVVEDAHVTISTVTKKTGVLATSSSCSSDLASKFLNFLDIPYTDVEIVSPFDVPAQHEVPNTQTTTLLPIPISVITTIPQSLQTFTPPPLVSTPT
ncbi:hypothetical protein Tco_1140240, partial [Tanacetum coccineum]